LADQHNNLVVDYVLYDQQWLPDLVDALHGQHVYFVGIKAPIEVVEHREKNRGTVPEGQARAYYDTVHRHGEYDLIVDASDLSAQQAADKIKAFIAENPQPTAFKKLYKELVK
jgi:chloramphenicol 3-O phosphotransferase